MLREANKANRETIFFILTKDGNFKRSSGDENQRQEHYDQIGGALKSITSKTVNKDGKQFDTWHILLEDKTDNARYDISMSKLSVAFKGIIRCLITEKAMANLDDIVIEVYKSKDFINSKVYAGGEKLRWSEEPMPPAEKRVFNGQEQNDYTAQLEWLKNQVQRINSKIEYDMSVMGPGEDAEYVPETDDLPE